MSMQINVDPAALSQEQREAVAGFILAYPGKACSGTCGHAVAEIPAFIHKDTADAGLVEVGRALDPEIAALVKDDGEFEASVAFGGHGSPELDADAAKLNAIFGQGAAGATLTDVGLAPAVAFGSAPAPLAQPATVAPSIAVAAPSLTAPAAPTPTSTATANVPVPPAPNTAPAAPAPTAHAAHSTPASGVEVDKHGLPWDGRIHAESKGKIADGTWRKKRQIDPALVVQVEAELRQVMGAAPAPLAQGVAPVPTPVSVAASTTVPPAPTGAVPQPVAPPPAPAPVAGAAPSMPAAPSAAPGEVPADARQQFVGLVGRASAAIQAGKVSQAEVTQICAAAGVPALPLLANRLDLVAHVAAQVDGLIASRQQ